MKSISKINQRKMFEMYEKAVDSESTLSILVNSKFNFSGSRDSGEILKEAKEKKEKFLSFLEEGISKEEVP